jgi:hypothetical protein
VDTSSSTNWRSAAVVTPTDDASLLGTKGDPLPPLSSAIAFLAGKLEHACIICPTIPHNVNWKNGSDVNKLFSQNPMTVYGRKQVPQCLLQDAATVRDKAIVSNWWVGLKKEEKREEYKALQKIYSTPSKNNSKVNDVPPPRRRNEARPNQPPVNDEFVYGGLGDTSEIRAASSSQLASFQATDMYKRTNRKRKKNEPARGPSDMYDSAVRQKMSIVEKRTNEVNALVTVNPELHCPVQNQAICIFIRETGTPSKNGKIPHDKVVRQKPEMSITGLNESRFAEIFSQEMMDKLSDTFDVKMVENGPGPVTEFNAGRKEIHSKDSDEIREELAEHVRRGFGQSRSYSQGEDL